MTQRMNKWKLKNQRKDQFILKKHSYTDQNRYIFSDSIRQKKLKNKFKISWKCMFERYM